jgi:DNA-directed RNA polymerase subunit RPC12/RpoP
LIDSFGQFAQLDVTHCFFTIPFFFYWRSYYSLLYLLIKTRAARFILENTRDLLIRGIAAAKAHLAGEARFYLEWILRLDPPKDQQNEALYWLSTLSTNPVEERKYLESILANDMYDPRARRRLLILDGKLKTGDLINPDEYKQDTETPQSSTTDKFTCPNCGGRMTFSPDGSSLECEYCNSRQFFRRQTATLVNDSLSGSDFISAMATASGHNQMISQQLVTCKGCGAEFLLTERQLSTSCPYCRSPQVVRFNTIRQMVPPARILPIEVGYQQAFTLAQKAMGGNLDINKMYDIRPAFYPVWQFELNGVVGWRLPAVEIDSDIDCPSGEEAVGFYTVPVMAVGGFFKQFPNLATDFDYARMEPYSPNYLVDCLAVGYKKTLSEAALEARGVTVRDFSQRIEKKLGRGNGEYFLSSSNLFISQFWLTMVPFWIFSDAAMGKAAVVNGQKGITRTGLLG